ncbi:hypothetical protein POVWA2_047340 [Plasmodium ovale wallikeri]|uniref:Uncharacterized protein n=1 Tax=Plasmodium ovale wallikeri TaxID=864142 RepID=A0A1A8ZJ71_PLAOA|nr:hypothetical protein POVWA1_029610 [Plasmodium ovale wallikeri]SBT44098.1 hypothetical protein POVWA2_047340 [Plasmodium ovale wallikeri]
MSEKEEIGIMRGAKHRVENAFSERYSLTYCHMAMCRLPLWKYLNMIQMEMHRTPVFKLLFSHISHRDCKMQIYQRIKSG